MIGEVMALIAMALIMMLPQTVAKAVFALSALVPLTSCFTVCAQWISVFFEASILGMFNYMLQYSFNLSTVDTILIDVAMSIAMSTVLLIGFKRDKVNEFAEVIASILILGVVTLSYLFPQASSQVLFALAQSLWLVDNITANALLVIAVIIASISILYEYNLFSFLFDPDYFEYSSPRGLFWPWLALTLLHLGISASTIALGLLATATVMALPGILIVRYKLKELDEAYLVPFSIVAYSLWLGCFLSEYYNVSEIAVAGAIFIILIVLPELWRWKGPWKLLRLGAKLAGAGKGDREQKEETRAVEESEGNS